MPRQSKFGTPVQFTPKSAMTVLMVDTVAAMNRAQPSTDLAPHESYGPLNLYYRNGYAEIRRGVSQSTQTSNPMGVTVTGGMEVVSSTGTFYPFISGTSRFAYHDGLGWSVLSYTSAFGNSAPPSGGSRDWYDMTQIYNPAVDDNMAVMACASQQTLFCWRAGSTVFSGLTSAPKAKYVTAFDNFLMAFNIKDSTGSNYVQRVQWSDRGNPSNWTGALSGFADLLDAKGQGTRILAQNNRVLLFFESEIWQAQRGAFPDTFRFTPLDRSVGSPYPRSVVDTPMGVMFMGRDQRVYLLPNDGGPAQEVSAKANDSLRLTPGNGVVWAMWDGTSSAYQIFMAQGGTNDQPPNNGFYFVQPDLTIHRMFYAFGQDRTHGFTAYKQGGTLGTTWSQASTAGYTWDSIPGTWDTYNVQSSLQERCAFMGCSTGTMYRATSTATTDDGLPISFNYTFPSLGGHAPETIKTITEVRVDYQSEAPTSQSRLTLTSLGQIASKYTADAVGPTVSGVQGSVTFHTQITDRFPTLYLTGSLPGGQFRFGRIWVTMTEGGRSYMASGSGS